MPYAPYEHYKPSPFGDIPSHWEIRRLKELLSHMIGGVWGQDKQEDENDIICLRVADFNYNQLSYNIDNFTIRNIAPKEQKGRMLKQGDILLEKSGGGEKTPVGRAIVFDGKYKAVCSNFIAKLTPKPDTNTKFLAFIMQTVYKTGIIQQYINQTTGIQNLQMSRYLTVNIPVPPLTEQIAIAAYLDHKLADIDTFIAKKQRLITLLQEQKAAMINKAVTKGLNEYENEKVPRPTEYNFVQSMPKHWFAKKLKYVANCLNNRRRPIEATERGRMKESIYDYYGATGVIDKVEDFIFDETTLLIAEDGANLKMRNLQLVYKATGKYWVNNHAHIITPKSTMNIDFLAAYLESYDYLPHITGSAQPKLTKEAFLNIFVPVPPLTEQIAIVSHIEAESARIDKAISLIERELTLVQEYRTALIAEAVTGKIKCPNVVEDANQMQSIQSSINEDMHTQKILATDETENITTTIKEAVTKEAENSNMVDENQQTQLTSPNVDESSKRTEWKDGWEEYKAAIDEQECPHASEETSQDGQSFQPTHTNKPVPQAA